MKGQISCTCKTLKHPCYSIFPSHIAFHGTFQPGIHRCCQACGSRPTRRLMASPVLYASATGAHRWRHRLRGPRYHVRGCKRAEPHSAVHN